MLQIALIILGCLILSAEPGSSLSCYVCLPDMVGNEDSKALAVELRANISRTWKGRTENSFGVCSKMANTEEYTISCNTESNLTTCQQITNGLWNARTCGVLPKANRTFTGCYNSMTKYNQQVTKTCLCKEMDLCNDACFNNVHWFLLILTLTLIGLVYKE